jgi:hypothetical protein
MSKPEPPHALRQSADLDASKPLSRVPTAVQIFTAVSLFLVVMTPIAYLNGRAFHDGWYGALNLDQAMFPMDTQGTLVQAAVAWADGLAVLFMAIGKAFKEHWLQLVMMIVVNSLVIAGFVWILNVWDRRRSKRSGKPLQRTFIRRAVARILSPMLVLGISVAAIYVAIFCLALVIAALILPFTQVGRFEAKKEIASNFSDMPMVTIKSAKGEVQRREISVGPQFFAFWSDGHASFAPTSAIEWGDAPPPGK